MKRSIGLKWFLANALLAFTASALAGPDVDTKFLNSGSIGNTRHNLTQRQTAGGGPDGTQMDSVRNDYAEVCVYCHTPHGANGNVQLPLWNRTQRVTTYQTYDQLGTSSLTQTVSQPGANSISCLSCHDGQTAVDSIINMPGSGRYDPAQATAQSNGFLNGWTNPGATDAANHHALTETGCLACHSQGGFGDAFATAADFAIFKIGTDLRNDHPVGITFPTSSADFQPTSGNTPRGDLFFDANGNGRMDPADVRLYNTGDGAEVECASCHDPHGVPSGGSGTSFNPTFLRVSNGGSSLCLTCHVK